MLLICCAAICTAVITCCLVFAAICTDWLKLRCLMPSTRGNEAGWGYVFPKKIALCSELDMLAGFPTSWEPATLRLLGTATE